MNDIVADGPVLCFGGPYSNLQATQALFAEARRLGVPPGRIVCTGDVLAYCADPAKFNAETGRIEARKVAINKLWPMVIYAERERGECR